MKRLFPFLLLTLQASTLYASTGSPGPGSMILNTGEVQHAQFNVDTGTVGNLSATTATVGGLSVTTATVTGKDANGYSLSLSSGISMPNGTVQAGTFYGNGAGLTHLTAAGVFIGTLVGGTTGFVPVWASSTVMGSSQMSADSANSITLVNSSLTINSGNFPGLFSLHLSSGINTPNGTISAGMFVGNGSALTNAPVSGELSQLSQSTYSLSASTVSLYGYVNSTGSALTIETITRQNLATSVATATGSIVSTNLSSTYTVLLGYINSTGSALSTTNGNLASTYTYLYNAIGSTASSVSNLTNVVGALSLSTSTLSQSTATLAGLMVTNSSSMTNTSPQGIRATTGTFTSTGNGSYSLVLSTSLLFKNSNTGIAYADGSISTTAAPGQPSGGTVHVSNSLYGTGALGTPLGVDSSSVAVYGPGAVLTIPYAYIGTATVTSADANGFSLTLSSGMNMPNGTLKANMFVGNGALLTNVPSTTFGGGYVSGVTTFGSSVTVQSTVAATAIVTQSLSIYSTSSVLAGGLSIPFGGFFLSSGPAIFASTGPGSVSIVGINSTGSSNFTLNNSGEVDLSSSIVFAQGTSNIGVHWADGTISTTASTSSGGTTFTGGTVANQITEVSTITVIGQDSSGYSLKLSSGLNAPNGTINANMFIGNGALLTNVPGGTFGGGTISGQTTELSTITIQGAEFGVGNGTFTVIDGVAGIGLTPSTLRSLNATTGSKLYVHATVGPAVENITTDDASQAGITFQNSWYNFGLTSEYGQQSGNIMTDLPGALVLYNQGGAPIQLAPGGAVDLTLATSGSVGISTFYPVGLLTVGSGTMTVLNNGFVGIDVPNANNITSTLTVTGTVAATMFVGNGSQLTNLPGGSTFSGGTITGQTTEVSTLTVIGSDATTQYSLKLSSGINMPAGTVNAGMFIGNGALLTNVPSTTFGGGAVSGVTTFASSVTINNNLGINKANGITVGTSIATATPCGQVFYIDSTTLYAIGGSTFIQTGSVGYPIGFSTYTMPAGFLNYAGDCVVVTCGYYNSGSPSDQTTVIDFNKQSAGGSGLYPMQSADSTAGDVNVTRAQFCYNPNVGIQVWGDNYSYANNDARYSDGATPYSVQNKGFALPFHFSTSSTYPVSCSGLVTGGGSLNFLFMRVAKGCGQ